MLLFDTPAQGNPSKFLEMKLYLAFSVQKLQGWTYPLYAVVLRTKNRISVYGHGVAVDCRLFGVAIEYRIYRVGQIK